MATGSTAAGSGRRTGEWSAYLRDSPKRQARRLPVASVTGLDVAGGGRWEVTLEAGATRSPPTAWS